MRHTESEANTKNILAGQLDYPLSEKGKNHAHRIASWYTSLYSPQIIYSSSLLRAKQTAEPFIAAMSLPFILDARLMEQNLGVLSGKTYEEAESGPRYETNNLLGGIEILRGANRIKILLQGYILSSLALTLMDQIPLS